MLARMSLVLQVLIALWPLLAGGLTVDQDPQEVSEGLQDDAPPSSFGSTTSTPLSLTAAGSLPGHSSSAAAATTTSSEPDNDILDDRFLPESCVFRQRAYGDTGIFPDLKMAACQTVRVDAVICGAAGGCHAYYRNVAKSSLASNLEGAIFLDKHVFTSKECQRECRQFDGCHNFIFVEDGQPFTKHACFLLRSVTCEPKFACLQPDVPLRVVSGPRSCPYFITDEDKFARNDTEYCVPHSSSSSQQSSSSSGSGGSSNFLHVDVGVDWKRHGKAIFGNVFGVVAALYGCSAFLFCCRLSMMELPRLPDRGSQNDPSMESFSRDLHEFADSTVQQVMQDPLGTSVAMLVNDGQPMVMNSNTPSGSSSPTKKKKKKPKDLSLGSTDQQSAEEGDLEGANFKGVGAVSDEQEEPLASPEGGRSPEKKRSKTQQASRASSSSHAEPQSPSTGQRYGQSDRDRAQLQRTTSTTSEDDGCCPDVESCTWCLTCGGTGEWKWLRTCGWLTILVAILMWLPKDAL